MRTKPARTILALLIALSLTASAEAAPGGYQFPDLISCGLPPKPCKAVCIRDLFVTISVQPDGKLLWNNTPLDRKTLKSYLSAALQDNPQAPFVFEQKGNVSYAAFARALRLFQRAGIRDIRCVVPNG